MPETKVGKTEIRLDAIYPVGAIYISTVDTNPGDLFGGTWVPYGEGRVLVGKAASGTFGTAGATMGAQTHTLTVAEMPAHDHGGRVAGSQNGDFFTYFDGSGGGGWGIQPGTNNNGRRMTIPSQGGGGAHNNIQPSIVVYMWNRTA